MRWGLLVLVLVGCGKVQAVSDAHVDAVPDAAEALTLTSAVGPLSLDAEGATGSVAVHVHTLAPAQAVDVMFTSSLGGTYTPPTVTVTTDASGNATAASTYTSNMAGTELTSIAGSIASTSPVSTTVTFPVTPLTRYGYATGYPTAGGFTPGYLLGIKLAVTAPGHLDKIGFYSPTAGPNIQVGIYTDNGGAPGTLFAQLPPTPVQMGANEIVVAPLPISAGSYWFMAAYDTVGHVGREGVGVSDDTINYTSFTYGGTLPTTFPAPMTQPSDHFNYYLVVGQ